MSFEYLEDELEHLLEQPEGCPPAYGGCTCSCHTTPGVTHCFPCCSPEDEDWVPEDEDLWSEKDEI